MELQKNTNIELNDDCWCQIFRYLSIREQLIVTNVSRSFRSVVTDLIWKAKYREVHTNSPGTCTLDNGEYQAFFALNVLNVEKFVISDTKHLAFTSYLGRYSWRPELSFYLSFDLLNLRVLICEDPRLHDGLIRLIAHRCPKLEMLYVASRYVTGAHIKNMPNLTQLYVPKCLLSTAHLEEIITNLKLTHLDISANPCDINVLTKLAPSTLVHLQLSDASVTCQFVENMHKISNLKLLRVGKFLQKPSRNSNWGRFFQIRGPKVKQMKLIKSDDKGNIPTALMDNIKYLTSLEKFYLISEVNSLSLEPYLQITTLKELHFCNIHFIPEFLALINNNKHLEHLYFDIFLYGLPVFVDWIFNLIDLLEGQNARKPLSLHVVEHDPENVVYALMKQEITESKTYQKQKILKFDITKCQFEKTIRESYLEFGF